MNPTVSISASLTCHSSTSSGHCPVYRMSQGATTAPISFLDAGQLVACPPPIKINEKLKPYLPSVGNVSMGGQSEKPPPVDGATQSNRHSQVLSRASRLKMCPGTETLGSLGRQGPGTHVVSWIQRLRPSGLMHGQWAIPTRNMFMRCQPGPKRF